MKDLTQEEAGRWMDAVPQAVQDAVASPETARTIGQIGKQHSLHVDTLGLLEKLTMYMLVGYLNPEQALDELLAASVPPTDARQMLKELNDGIFTPLRVTMRANSTVAKAQTLATPRPVAPAPRGAAAPAPVPSRPQVQPAPQPTQANPAELRSALRSVLPAATSAPQPAAPLKPAQPTISAATSAAVPSSQPRTIDIHRDVAPLPPKVALPRPVGMAQAPSAPRVSPPAPERQNHLVNLLAKKPEQSAAATPVTRDAAWPVRPARMEPMPPAAVPAPVPAAPMAPAPAPAISVAATKPAPAADPEPQAPRPAPSPVAAAAAKTYPVDPYREPIE